MNLLESAGFSRANPYYIVPQGRITSLTNSKDSERLNLLKEVAGTKVYETRRLESVKIMNETNTKREQIHELLEYIETRMLELEQEKKELAEFLTADRERKSLEYALYSHEQNLATEQLAELEEMRAQEQAEALARHKNLSDRLMVIEEIENELATAKQKLELLELEKLQCTEDIQEKLTSKAKLTLACQDIQGTTW